VGRPAQQDWVIALPCMQQSVLFASVRAPDNIRKDHPVKVLLRWYRRCVLLGSFEGRALTDPFEPGGGSFTGPFTAEHAADFGVAPPVGHIWHGMTAAQWWSEVRWTALDRMREVYLRHVDELPHHFQLHFMHAAEIVGYEHPNRSTADWWEHFYLMLVNDAHLFPESKAQMRARLSDNEEQWRAREEVTAK
jgi:hypothetical protein